MFWIYYDYCFTVLEDPMDSFILRQFFSFFRRKAIDIQPQVEPLNDPKVQAYLDYLRDHGPEADYVAPKVEEPMLALPWAA